MVLMMNINTTEQLDVRDITPGAEYFTLAQASRGGRCVMNGMFIAAWTTKKAAKAAAAGDPDMTVVRCLKPVGRS
jgi:hypothetical protein